MSPGRLCLQRKQWVCWSYHYNSFSIRLTIHLNDSSFIAFHLKNHSIPKSKFQKILVENTTIITHKIDKLQLQILEALHIKTKKPKINRINFELSDNILKCFLYFFFNPVFL